MSNEMKQKRIVSNKNQSRRSEHRPREGTLNRASDYLKIAVLWIKVVLKVPTISALLGKLRDFLEFR